MVIYELLQPIQYLDANTNIHQWLNNTLARCVNESSAYSVIREIVPETKATEKDRYNDKLPFYYIALAYAYHITPEWSQAILYAIRAEQLFNKKQNEAVSKWFSGLLLCIYEESTDAQRKIDEALNLISKLNNEMANSGRYEIQDKDYQYPKIIDTMEKSYTALKTQIFNQISSKLHTPVLNYGFFSNLIELLLIPENDDLSNLQRWRNDSINLKPPALPNDKSFIDKIFTWLDKSHDPTIERALICILLAHRYNLVDYSTRQQSPQTGHFAQEAKDLFQIQVIDANYYLSCCYLELLDYNNNDQGKGRLHLEEAINLLEKVRREYKHIDLDEYSIYIQNLQNALHNWVFPFKFGETKQREESQSSRWKIGNLPVLKKNKADFPPVGSRPSKKPQLQTSEPETTSPVPFKRNEIVSSFPRLRRDNQGRSPARNQPPETPRTPPPENKNAGEENESSVQLIVVPVDMNALDKTSINDSPVSADLFNKLANYDDEYHRLKGGRHSAPSQKAQHQQRIIIPSYPIRGQATANPRGEAVLPSMDGSQAPIAPEVDKTMILHIQNRSYLVHLLDGAHEIHGGSQTHDWFQVDGDSMNIAKPIPIEDQDYVLFDKSPCSLKSCEGKIVLASVREVNIDPTRLMIKKFVVINPEQHPEFNDTVRFLLSESRSKYKAIELTNEYKLEGKVVAIAKPI